MNDIEIFLRVCLLGFSCILTAVALISLRKAGGLKLFLAFSAFIVFLLEGITLVLGIFIPSLESSISIQIIVFLNLIALLLFYGSLVRQE